MSQNIVISIAYGVFSLSKEAVLLGRQLSGDPNWGGPCIRGDVYKNGCIHDYDDGFISGVERDNPILVQVVKQLGSKSYGECAKLTIVEVPDDVEWVVKDYDGKERVEEKHQVWY